MMLPMLVLVAGLAPAPEPAAIQEPAAPKPEASEASVHLDAGLKAFKRRRYVQAEAEFRKAVEANPESAAAHFYLGYTYYKRTEPRRRLTPDKQRAAEEFAKAFELDPAFRPVWGSKRAPEPTTPPPASPRP
jgi:tetratricopeptide (TPR) repeat protein